MEIIEIAEKIASLGGRLYLVGGCVRDMFLGKKSHDQDYCVTGLTPEQFYNLFPDAKTQGKSFPVFIINGCEFALARKERKIGEKHSDFICDTSPLITIEDDLMRRDLTINSIAIDVLTEKLIDPFDGREDIEKHILRMTGPSFKEDPLRVYRVARFASQFHFRVDKETIATMKQMKDSLSHLSVERVFQEFRKALQSEHPSDFFQVLRECECLDVHFQEIANLIGIEQPAKYHPEGDAYNHTIDVLGRVSTATSDEYTRFGALVHDFGKAVTPREKWPHHYDHEVLGINLVQQFCCRLKMPIAFWKAGRVACREHMLAGNYNALRIGTKVDFIERVTKARYLSLKGLEIIANADTSKKQQVSFAEIGERIMSEVSFTEDDRKKLSIEHGEDKIKIRTYIREKRIDYLRKLEKVNVDISE